MGSFIFDICKDKTRDQLCADYLRTSRAAFEFQRELEEATDEIERLRAAISDNLPGLASIDEGEWHEYTGDLVLKEDQWRAICVAAKELRIALAGGEMSLPSDKNAANERTAP